MILCLGQQDSEALVMAPQSLPITFYFSICSREYFISTIKKQSLNLSKRWCFRVLRRLDIVGYVFPIQVLSISFICVSDGIVPVLWKDTFLSQQNKSNFPQFFEKNLKSSSDRPISFDISKNRYFFMETVFQSKNWILLQETCFNSVYIVHSTTPQTT